MKNLVSERSQTIEYAIRDVVVEANKVEAAGNTVLKLNIGDPNAYDFDTPQLIKDALIEAIQEKGNGYSASDGIIEVREAIVEKERKQNNVTLDPNKIILTNGVSEGLLFLFGSMIENGDEILVPGPSYPPYISFVRYFGGEAIEYRTIEEEGWQPDLNDLESKITEKTKAVVIINPNNPTGAAYSKATLQKIIDIIAPHNIPIISDEIYDQMTYGTHTSPCSLSPDIDFIQMNGISKCYLAPGWRLGNLAFSERLGDLYEACMKQARIRLCANRPVQYAYAQALRGDHSHIKNTMKKLVKRRDFAYKRLNEIEGISTAKPEGAFYIFPKIEDPKWQDDKQFVLDLLREKHVLFVHGSGFGKEYGSGHFRSVYLPPVETLEIAFTRLDEFMQDK